MELKKGVYQIRTACVDCDGNRKVYNSYVVRDEKTAVIDTVPESAEEIFIKSIEEIVPLSDIDYVICNHTEPDRAGCVGKLAELNSNITFIGTIAALRNLKEMTDIPFKSITAKDNARLSLGEGKTLKFIITPNMHWPDTMVTYLEEAKILFSCDIFSADYYDSIYDDNVKDLDKYISLFEKRYNNLMSPFEDFVRSGAEKIEKEQIELICVGEGPLIKTRIKQSFEIYRQEKEKSKAAAVFYTSRHGCTKYMSEIIADTMEKSGTEVKIFDVNKDFKIAVKAANEYGILIFGSPTINRNAVPEISDLISEIDAVKAANKPCFVFGSYGWGGEALTMIQSRLKQMRMKVFEKPFGCVLKPLDKDKKELTAYTKRFIEKELH